MTPERLFATLDMIALIASLSLVLLPRKRRATADVRSREVREEVVTA